MKAVDFVSRISRDFRISAMLSKERYACPNLVRVKYIDLFKMCSYLTVVLILLGRKLANFHARNVVVLIFFFLFSHVLRINNY